MRDPDRIVVLIRHSVPEVDPERPASEWALSAEGINRCETLASELKRFLPAILLSSPETKAIETAELVGAKLGLKFSIRDGLCEHRRPTRFLPHDEFHDNIHRFFEFPAGIVYGNETSDQVASRIESEIRRALAISPTENVLIITHGTAMTSFIRQHTKADPFEIWKSLDLPSYVALGVPTFDIVDCGGVDRGLFHMTDTGVDS